MSTATSRSAAVAITAPTGAVLPPASRSAPVWRRWRAVPPPHPLPLMRRRLISITRPATNVRTPPKTSGRQASKVHVEISRGISYATPICEPTQTECFAYDAWNKSCPGAFSLADPCAGGGWCSHFAVGFGGLPQRREGCVAGRPTRAHRDGRVARRGGEGIADRRDPAALPNRHRLSGQRQDPRAAG